MFSPDAVRALGPIARGCFRVVVRESNGAVAHHDFATRREADDFAAEIARESVADDGCYAVAEIFDHDGEPLSPRARPIASGGWPDFATPTAIDATRSWTAAHESFDERLEDAYYVITLFEHGRRRGDIVAAIGGISSPNDPRLATELARIAAGGRSNCDYRGSVARPIVTIDE
jgi:hypothetical protein